MTAYILNDNLFSYLTEDGSVHLSLPHEENVKFSSSESDFILTVLDIFRSPQDHSSFEAQIEDTQYAIDDIPALFMRLEKLNIIKKYISPASWTTSLTAKQLAKYDRQLRNFAMLPGNTLEDAFRLQECLGNAKILMSLRQFVWWGVGPRCLRRGFFVCGV